MDIYQSLRQVQQEAYDRAPAIRALYDTTGMKPADLRSVEELTRLPVTKKEALLDHQRENPPFGGYLAADPTQIARSEAQPQKSDYRVSHRDLLHTCKIWLTPGKKWLTFVKFNYSLPLLFNRG